MNLTNYFVGVKIGKIKSLCQESIQMLQEAKKMNLEISSDIWISASFSKLNRALEKHYSEIDPIISKMTKFIDILDVAHEVKELQKLMKTETDADKQKKLADQISEKMKQIYKLVVSDYGMSSIMEKIVHGSSSIGELKVNYPRLRAAKTDVFNVYAKAINSAYHKFENIEILCTDDEYLKYYVSKVFMDLDRLLKQKNSISAWWSSYITNFKTLENGLPDKTSFTITLKETKKIPKTHKVASQPDPKSYKKEHTVVKKPKPTVNSTYYGGDSNNSTSTIGTSGSYLNAGGSYLNTGGSYLNTGGSNNVDDLSKEPKTSSGYNIFDELRTDELTNKYYTMIKPGNSNFDGTLNDYYHCIEIGVDFDSSYGNVINMNNIFEYEKLIHQKKFKGSFSDYWKLRLQCDSEIKNGESHLGIGDLDATLDEKFVEWLAQKQSYAIDENDKKKYGMI